MECLQLSDDSDINSYRFQCTLPGRSDNEHLCLKDSEERLFPYYAVAVGHTEKEFEENIEKQLNATFGRLLNSPNQAEKAQESKPKPELLVKLYGRGIRKTHTYEVYGKSGSIEFQLTDKIAFESDDAFWKYVNEHRAELEENTEPSEKNFPEAKRIGEAAIRSEIGLGRTTVKGRTLHRKCFKRPSDSEALSSETGSSKAKTAESANGCLTMPTIPLWICRRF